MTRPLYLDSDLFQTTQESSFEDQRDDAISSLTFHSALPRALSGLRQARKAFEPLPIMVSGSRDAGQVAREQQQAQPAPVPMPSTGGYTSSGGGVESVAGSTPAGEVATPVTQSAETRSAAAPASHSAPIPSGPEGSKEAKQAEVYRQARANGLDDEGARILVAVTETEGGLAGAIGDQGQSRGGYQFHEGGQMPGFRAWLAQQGIQGDANQLVHDIRLTTRYAATTYLGRAIAAGRGERLSGADLATYVQRHGQVSVDPERTGQNYQRMFGGQGAPAPTGPTASPSVAAPSPPAGVSSGPPAAAGSGATITVRDPWGNVLTMPRSAYETRPGGNADLTVISDGRQSQQSPLDAARAGTDEFQASALSMKDMPQDEALDDGRADGPRFRPTRHIVRTDASGRPIDALDDENYQTPRGQQREVPGNAGYGIDNPINVDSSPVQTWLPPGTRNRPVMGDPIHEYSGITTQGQYSDGTPRNTAVNGDTSEWTEAQGRSREITNDRYPNLISDEIQYRQPLSQQPELPGDGGSAPTPDPQYGPPESEAGPPVASPSLDPGGAQFAAQDAYSAPQQYGPWASETTPSQDEIDRASVAGLQPGQTLMPPQESPAQPYGTVTSTPGEPDYAPPRSTFQPTSTERRAFEDAGTQMGTPAGPKEITLPEWMPEPIRNAVNGTRVPEGVRSGLGAGLGAVQAIGAATNYASGRFDVGWVPILARSGIIENDLPPEQAQRIRYLIEKGARTGYLEPSEEEELTSLWGPVEQRYQQVKNDPDQLMGYFSEAPGSILVPIMTGLVTSGTVGPAAARAGAGAARAAGAGARTARGVGYAADVAAQSAIDPSNIVGQPAADAAVQGVRGAYRGARAAGRGIQAGAEAVGEGIERAGTRVREGLVANSQRVAELDAQAARQGSTVAAGTFGPVPTPESGGTIGRGGAPVRDVVDRSITQDWGPDVLADELAAVGAKINEDGTVTLYHRTTPERAAQIRQSGTFIGKEDGVFFSTKPDGQTTGYGDAVVEARVPVDDLTLDDMFGDEAHLRVPTIRAGVPYRGAVLGDVAQASQSQGIGARALADTANAAPVPRAAQEGATPGTRRYYHGTGSSFDEFDPGNPETWLTANPDDAHFYAQTKGARSGSTGATTMAVDVPDDLNLIHSRDPHVQELQQQSMAEARAAGGNLIDVMKGAKRRLVDRLMAEGYDGLDARVGSQDQVVLFPNALNRASVVPSDASPGIVGRVKGALAANAERTAAADARMTGQPTFGTFGPVPAPETRIPRAGSVTDISPGAETMVREATEANAPDSTMSRADVAAKAERILGMDPERARAWQDAALAEAEDARPVRGEVLRQAEYIDAENANRAIERLRTAQERARNAPNVSDLSGDEKSEIADAVLEAAEAARAFGRSERASTAEGRAAARALGQRRRAITARQAFETAQRARQTAQDAASAASEVFRASRSGQVTTEGVQRLRTLRDKLVDEVRNGLSGDGAGGRLDALEQAASPVRPVQGATPAGRSPIAPGRVDRSQIPTGRRLRGQTPQQTPRRPGIPLGTQLATDAGNSVLGSFVGGTAGYMAPADSDEQRLQNARTGLVAGAIGYPIVGRTMRRNRGGALSTFGPAPAPDSPNRAIAVGADPSKRYEFRYRVADLGELVPSNLPNGTPNPAFPRELQPRSRERVASQLQIDQIAQGLEPDALLNDFGRLDVGPMIVGPDNLVESGNGRALALQRAAEQHPEKYQAYADSLRGRLKDYGLDESALEGVQRPVLVRERVSDVDRAAFVQEANSRSTLGMSGAEQAGQSAANLSDDVVSNLTIGENDTIASALRRTDNRDVVRQWIGSLPENERSIFLDENGEISTSGYDQLANTLLVRTYGDGAGTRAFIESAVPEVRNVQVAIMGSLPDMARAEALIRAGQRDPGLSVAGDVAAATEVLARLRRDGQSVGDYVKQIAMGDRELTPFQEEVLQFLDQNQRRPSSIRQALREYADVVENAADPNQVDMFGGEVASVTKEDAWKTATSGVQRERRATVAAQKSKVEAVNAARTPAHEIVPSTGGAPGELMQEGAPVRLADPTQAERGFLPSGGPEGQLAQEGAPTPLARPTQAERGQLPTGGPEDTLTLASGRSVKDVVASIDEVLANPNAAGAVERFQALHEDLREISQQGFKRSSDIKARLHRNGLLRAGLAGKADDVEPLVRALANVDPSKPEEMQAVLQVLSKPRLIDRILEYQYVNMLSSPITQAVNIASNSMQIAGRLLFQNPLEFAFSGGQSTGVGAAFQGAARGFREGLGEAGQIMRTGTSSNAIDRAIEMGDYTHVNREALTEQFGKAGAALHFISTRPLAAMDALLGHTAYASAAEQYAQRAADRLLKEGSPKVQGMSRQAARQHVMSNIWDYPEIIEKAGKIEDYTLLKSNDSGTKVWGPVETALRRMGSLRNPAEDAGFGGQVVSFMANQILPFFNVPLNFAKQGAERTFGVPVNVVRGIAEKNPEKRAELFAKAAIGASAMTTGGVLAAGDNLTGDGPSDAGKREVWLQSHRPNSFRLPGTKTWYSWEGTPFAIPFGMMAGAKEGWSEAQERSAKKGQSDPVDVYGSAALKAGQGVSTAFLSQSFVRGLADQYKLLTGQDVGMSSQASSAASTASRFLPASGMLNFMARVADDMERDTGKPQAVSDMPEAVGARIANRIPGARQQLDPKLDIYGEPVRNEQQGLAGMVPYFRGDGARSGDPITQRLGDAGQGVSPPPTEISVPNVTGSKIVLNMREQRIYQQAAGQARRRRLESVMNSGRYDGLPTAARAEMLDDIERDARAEAAAAVRRVIGPAELRRRDVAAPKQPAGGR